MSNSFIKKNKKFDILLWAGIIDIDNENVKEYGENMARFNEKYFNADPKDSVTIDSLLSEDEQVLLRAKPNKKAFILSRIFSMFPIALIWLIFDGTFLYFFFTEFAKNGLPTIFIVLICVFFALHLIPVWIWLSRVLTAYAYYKNNEFCITNKRIICKSGLIADIKNVYFQDIVSVNVKVGLMDKMLKVGDIYVRSTNEAVVLFDIENPYAIGNQLQQIVNDIKTDIHYPNALRPEDNRGYQTKYTAEFTSDLNADQTNNDEFKK